MRLGFVTGVAVLCGALAATATTAATAAAIQGPQLRVLEQGSEHDWKHARSGVEFPASLLGVKREAVQDTTPSEYDVFARYLSDDKTTLISLHLYSPAVMSVPLWFDRAHAAITLSGKVGDAKPATAFAPPGSRTASAMRVGYALPDGATAMALAMAPVGDWMVKLTVVGKGSAADVEAMTGQILTAMNLPDTPDAPAAAEVQQCATPLQYGEAKALEPDRARAQAVTAMILKKQDTPSGSVWCREGKRDVEWTHYRRTDTTDGYLLALGDAGRALEVKAIPAPEAKAAPAGDDARPTEFAVVITSGSQIYQYPRISGFPSPQQAADLLATVQPVALIARDTGAVDLLMDEAQAGDGAGKS